MWQWCHNSLSSKSNYCPYQHFLWKCFLLRILGVLVICCVKFHKNLLEEFRQFETSLNSYKKVINYAWTEAGLNADKFATFWRFSKKCLSLIHFANDVYTLYNWLSASKLARFLKNMKTCESVKCNAELFLSFQRLKTAIRPKFVNSNWSVCYKIPVFRVHWKLFKLSNVGAKLSKHWSDVIDLARFLLWDFLLSRV